MKYPVKFVSSVAHPRFIEQLAQDEWAVGTQYKAVLKSTRFNDCYFLAGRPSDGVGSKSVEYIVKVYRHTVYQKDSLVWQREILASVDPGEEFFIQPLMTISGQFVLERPLAEGIRPVSLFKKEETIPFEISSVTGSGLGKLLCRLHAGDVAQLSALHSVPIELKSRLRKAVLTLQALVAEFNSPSITARLEFLISEVQPVLTEFMNQDESHLIHGDMHLRNVLALKDGRFVLIDSDKLSMGHRCFDFGSVYLDLFKLTKTKNNSLNANFYQFISSFFDAYFTPGIDQHSKEDVARTPLAAIICELVLCAETLSLRNQFGGLWLGTNYLCESFTICENILLASRAV